MPDTDKDNPLLLAILFGLTAVTGMVDAVSFLSLGRVFTANMTGNVVLLAFAMAGVPGLSVPKSLSALAAYLVGASIGGWLGKHMDEHVKLIWMSLGCLIEATFLIGGAFVAVWGADNHLLSTIQIYFLIACTAVAMGVRNALIRRVGVKELTTTVLTLTITGIAADSTLAGGKNTLWKRRVGAVCMMLIGACMGAKTLSHSTALPLTLAGILSGLSAIVLLELANRYARVPAFPVLQETKK